jgi:allantoinase
VLEDGPARVDLVLRNGVIAEITEQAAESGGQRVDATGLTVLPGGIDIHAHLRDPCAVPREGFPAGTASAVAGGITTVGEMPQADPLVADLDSLRLKRERAERGAITDYALYAAAIGQTAADLTALRDAGVRAFKAYMCASSPGYPMMTDPDLLDCMAQMAELGLPLLVHAENDAIVKAARARMDAAGRTDPMAHAEARPAIAETEAISRAVVLAEHTGARLHIVHVSNPDGVRVVADAAARGVNVTCETCPHYLLLDHSDLVRLGVWARCAPPLRDRASVEAMWTHVLAGHVQALGSDHSPYTIEEKSRGTSNIFEAPLGLNVIQVMLPAVLSEALHNRGMSLQQFAELTATGPAQVIGLYPRKGVIRVGSDADLTLWDLSAEWEVRPEALLSRHKWTPLEGKKVRGQVQTTIRRGEVVFAQGRVTAEPGSGSFLPWQHPESAD